MFSRRQTKVNERLESVPSPTLVYIIFLHCYGYFQSWEKDGKNNGILILSISLSIMLYLRSHIAQLSILLKSWRLTIICYTQYGVRSTPYMYKRLKTEMTRGEILRRDMVEMCCA